MRLSLPVLAVLVLSGMGGLAFGGPTAEIRAPHTLPAALLAPGASTSTPSLRPATTAGGSSSYWIDLTSKYSTAPQARAFAGMVWDTSAGEYILYGGEDNSATLSDTWGFTIAGGWKNLNPSNNPGGLAEPAMAYDSTDSEVVMFGGCTGLTGCPQADTYVFSQGTWTHYTTGTQPPATLAAGISDDPAAGDVVLFGGCGSFSILSEACSSSGFLDTTYTFTAAAGWKSVSSPTYPSAREAPFMAYDPAIGAPLLFGGYNGNMEFGDTWMFKGGQWTQLNPATSPTPGTNGVMFWDAALNAMVLYGGDTAAATVGTTWEYSGGNWTQLFPPPGQYPVARDGVMGASSTTGTPIVWGGEENSSTLQQDTWTFDPLSAPTTVTPTATDVNQPVSFSATISGGDPPLTISWAFGDGTTATVANTSHTYSSPCTCSATFTVTDALGQTAGGTTVVTISALPTITAAVNDTTALVGVSLQFWGNATGGTAPTNITWTFGDGLTGSGPTPWHPYSVPGTKTVTVTVVDGIGKSASATLSVTVKAPPGALVVSFVATPTTGTSPLQVWFNSTVTGGVGGDVYAWSFGDAATSAAANTTHLYVHPGSFAANLTVTDSAGHTGATSTTITVAAPPLTVTAVATPTEGSTPLSVLFTPSPGGGVAPYSYNWTFGDGPEYSHATDPSHVFNNTGTTEVNYTVNLVVTDHESPGATRSTELTISVLPTPPLVASLSYWQNPPTNFSANYFVDVSGGIPGYYFLWSFGDGSTVVNSSSANTTSHEYTTAESYHLAVTVVDAQGKNVTVTGTVNVGSSSAADSGSSGGFSVAIGPDAVLYVLLPMATAALLTAAVYLGMENERRRHPGTGLPPPHPAMYSEPTYYPGSGWR